MNDPEFDHEPATELEALLMPQQSSAPEHLRPRILQRVHAELAAQRRSRWESRALLAAAALLLAGVFANLWVTQDNRQSLARYFDDQQHVPGPVDEWSQIVALVVGSEWSHKLHDSVRRTLRTSPQMQLRRRTEAVQQLLQELALHDYANTRAG